MAEVPEEVCCCGECEEVGFHIHFTIKEALLYALLFGFALGALSHYIWQEHGESICDGVTGLFTPKKTRNSAASSTQEKTDDNTFSMKIPPGLIETVHIHENDLKREVSEMIEDYKKEDEGANRELREIQWANTMDGVY